jgi:hypothetical protein
MKVNIHNQCSNFKLKYKGCFTISANINEDPDEEVDAGSMTSIDLEHGLSTFGGVLTYELQRKRANHGNRPRSIYTRLFMTWKTEGYKKFRVLVQLIEYDKIPWLKFGSEGHYRRYVSQLCTYTSPIEDTWLMPDGTVLTTRLELDFTQRDGVLNMTISEGVKDERTKKPEWVGPER